MASPNVTLPVTPETVVVEQPVAFAIVQVEPVKPFVQIHAQAPLSMILDPPFLQPVVEDCSHCCTALSVVADDDLFLWKTKNSSGTTTAAAATTRSRKRISKKPQTGRPQQRRFFLAPFS